MPAARPTMMLLTLFVLVGSLKRMIPATATMILFRLPVRLYMVAEDLETNLKGNAGCVKE